MRDQESDRWGALKIAKRESVSPVSWLIYTNMFTVFYSPVQFHQSGGVLMCKEKAGKKKKYQTWTKTSLPARRNIISNSKEITSAAINVSFNHIFVLYPKLDGQVKLLGFFSPLDLPVCCLVLNHIPSFKKLISVKLLSGFLLAKKKKMLLMVYEPPAAATDTK